MVRFLIIASLIGLAPISCSEGKFRGGNAGGRNTCEQSQRVVGINLATIIDNSNSNSRTDCVDPKTDGFYAGTSTAQYQCQSATNRERAVEAAFDILTGNLNPADERSRSRLSITSFPTSSDISNGYEVRAGGWLEALPESKQTVTDAMQFTRRPIGKTPYGAGMLGAKQMFDQVQTDDRPKVAILVTDGEPTDADASGARRQAQQLKDLGAKIITIFVTGDQERQQRINQHTNYLVNIEGQSQENVDLLIGTNGQQSLVDAISDERIEVSNSSEIQRVLEDVIVRSVGCE